MCTLRSLGCAFLGWIIFFVGIDSINATNFTSGNDIFDKSGSDKFYARKPVRKLLTFGTDRKFTPVDRSFLSLNQDKVKPLTRIGCVFNVFLGANYKNDNEFHHFDSQYCNMIFYHQMIVDKLTGDIHPSKDLTSRLHLQKFTNLVHGYNNPAGKCAILVVGEEEGSHTFNGVASDANKLKTFLETTVKTLRSYRFQGLAVNWRYTSTIDNKKYLALLYALKNIFDSEKKDTEAPRLKLSVFVEGNVHTIKTRIPVKEINKTVEEIHVVQVDYSKVDYNRATIFNALYDLPTPHPAVKGSMMSTLNAWVIRGASPSKINLVFLLKGIGFVLKDKTGHMIGNLTIVPTKQNKLASRTGEISYSKIRRMIHKRGGFTETMTLYDQTAYWYDTKDGTWINYENVISLKQKVSVLRRFGIKGAILMSQSDDLHHFGGYETLPMTKALYNSSGIDLSDDNLEHSFLCLPDSHTRLRMSEWLIRLGLVIAIVLSGF